jgi:hypothetical protein
MPRLPGRESTRVEIDFEDVGDVASFVYVWDKYVAKKPCQIKGCGHIVSGYFDTEKHEYVNCGETAGAAIVYDKKPVVEGKKPAHYLICPCCLGRLDEAWREMHGDPE